MNLKRTFTAIALSTLCFSTGALADDSLGFNADDLVKASTSAIAIFKAASPEHFEHLSGFKAWKSGTEAKVKIYITHDGMTMENNYLCQKHGEDVHCTAQ